MRVKTDIGAFVTGGVLAAVLTMVATGDGSPPGSSSPMRLDAYVLQGLRGALVYLLLFVGAHFGLRRLLWSQRWAYAGAGAAAAFLSVALATPLAAWSLTISRGTLSFYIGVIVAAGAIMGFLYAWRAGLEADADDPVALAAELATRGPEPSISSNGRDDAFVEVGAESYFSGPTQVRTSLPVAFVAALLSAGLLAIFRVLLGGFADLSARMGQSPGASIVGMLGESLQNQALTVVILGFMAPIPMAFAILFGHFLARAWGRDSYKAYILIGAAAPVVLGLLAGVLGFFMGLQAIVPMAIAMAVYRNMAGLELKPVKEDIQLNDRRNLVGESHVRRRFGRLVKG